MKRSGGAGDATDSGVRERFELAAKATQDLLWDWDLARGELVWAGATRPYFGQPPEDIISANGDPYQTWADRVHPEDLQATERAARAAIEGGAESWEHEYRFRRADDSYAPILERAIIARDSAGRALRVVGAMRDLTTRREVERATTRLAAIVASSTDAIIGKSLEGVVTSWNAAAEQIFGYAEREMVGQSIYRLIPEHLHEEERNLLDRIRRGERVDFAEAERIRKDGTRIYIALTVSPIWDSSGKIVGASSIKRDISERKRAEEELARREKRYSALVTATTSVVWTADPAGRFDHPQTSWEGFTGQSWQEQEGLGWMSAIHAEDRPTAVASWQMARERGTTWEGRVRLWSQSHQAYRRCVARAAPVLGADGTVREWIGTVTDAEDRWRAEERLRHADRMESVGRLAGGIAHEANNQMTVILGAAEFLARGLRDESARTDVDHIRRAARRTATITQQLLAFSRRQVLQPELVDLNAVVTTLEPILQRALGEISQVKLRLADDLGAVKADPGQLDQILLNLTLNARDAMPAGGTLTIETTNVVVDEGYASGRAVEPVAPGMYAALMVSDTGTGMGRETLEHIFEPFFTTKAVGEGTGLGLATVYGIVKQSGGFVSAYSEPGHGSSFRIYLPLSGTRLESGPAVAPSPLGGGTESILVAEDEPAVRAIIARSLRSYGYTVLEARDGLHAVELAEAAAAPPALVITDIVMPGMGGKRLAAELQERWPSVPLLFTSGYSGLDAVRRGLLDEGTDFMQKPLEPETVAKKVRQILDAQKDPARR
jgi:PAS domain S-box-containing protein